MKRFRLVGVLHLPPLPGAANYRGQPVRDISEAAAEDARVLQSAGFTDVMVQDASDHPQPILVGPATVAALAVVGASVRSVTDVGLGVVVGHNDGASSVAIAHAIGADFVRVKVLTGVSAGPSGFIEGCAVQVAQAKRQLGSGVEVWADAHEATSAVLVGDLLWSAQQSVDFGGADKLIITRDSGVADALADIAVVKANLGYDVDVLVGGRVTAATLPDVLASADGAILGSVLKTTGTDQPRVDPAKADELGALLTGPTAPRADGEAAAPQPPHPTTQSEGQEAIRS